MKFAVCSRSSTARRNPPSVMRGTRAVAALPTGFKRRSRILLAPLTADRRRFQFVDHDTDHHAPALPRAAMTVANPDTADSVHVSELAGPTFFNELRHLAMFLQPPTGPRTSVLNLAISGPAR